MGDWRVLTESLVFIEEDAKLLDGVVSMDKDADRERDSKGGSLVRKEVGGEERSDCAQRGCTGVLLSVGVVFKTHELTHQKPQPTYGGRQTSPDGLPESHKRGRVHGPQWLASLGGPKEQSHTEPGGARSG
jgi:hypothetical protein